MARATAILEGIALSADPRYKIIMEAYPFVTRKLLKDSTS
jgi:aarF domain-containing kinase